MRSLLSLLLVLLSSNPLGAKIISSLELRSDKVANVVIFISKDCPCSQANIGHINNLAAEFKDYHFVAVHSKKEVKSEEIANYINDKELNFDIVNDSDLKIADTYKALKTPHAYIVKNNEIFYNGGITNTTSPDNAKEFFLKDALVSMKKNGKPDKTETKTLGCFIVR